MKTKTILGMTIFLFVAQVSLVTAGQAVIKVGPGRPLPPGVTVVYGNEAQMVAAGVVTVTEVRAVPCPSPTTAPAAPAPSTTTYNFQQTPAPTPAVVEKEKIVYVEKKKCGGWKHFWRSCGCWVTASASVNIVAGAPLYYPTYWERNDSAYESCHYGTPYYPDQVFWYGATAYPQQSVVSYGAGYRFVDNYRGSGPYGPVRFIPDPPRGRPMPGYQPYCPPPRQTPPPRPPQQGGGHRGGRPGR